MRASDMLDTMYRAESGLIAITRKLNHSKNFRLLVVTSAITLHPTERRSPCRGSNNEIACSNGSLTLALIIIWIIDDEIPSLPLFALHLSIKLRAD